jgi:hypothetical protein
MPDYNIHDLFTTRNKRFPHLIDLSLRSRPRLRRDVIAYCYGIDIRRKRKLLEKQKEGKKVRQLAKGDIPREAFIAALRADSGGYGQIGFASFLNALTLIEPRSFRALEPGFSR